MSVVAGGAGMGGSDDGDDREKKNINPQSCHSVKRSRTEEDIITDDAAAKGKFILGKDGSASTSIDMNNSDRATALGKKVSLEKDQDEEQHDYDDDDDSDVIYADSDDIYACEWERRHMNMMGLITPRKKKAEKYRVKKLLKKKNKN